MKYLLDTDHVSFLQRPSGPEYAVLSLRLSERADGEVGMSIISFHEQVLGAHTFLAKAKTGEDTLVGYRLLAKILELFRSYPITQFDRDCLNRYQVLKNSKIRIGAADLRIAAIALAGGLTLLSRNLKDFSKVPGLLVEDWTA